MHEPSFRWIGNAAIGAAMMLPALPARAQFVCSDHDEMVSGLAETFEEKRLGYGVVGRTAVIEIYVSERGTWTVLMTDVRGRSCVIAAGDGWESSTSVAGRGVPEH